MEGPTVWMAAFFIPPICLISFCVATYALMIPKMEAVKQGATKLFEDVRMKETLKEPKCSTILCAFVGCTFLHQLDTTLFFYNRTVPFGWSSLLCLSIIGLIAGDMPVMILNCMKRIKDPMSRDWVGVSLLIPLMSVGFILLRCIANSCDFEELIVKSSWICISAPFILLGGYGAAHLGSDYPELPLINSLVEPITRTKQYVICAVNLVIIYLGSFYSFLWIMNIQDTSSLIESVILVALGILVLTTFVYVFLVFWFVIPTCSRRFGCCWWKAFFCLAVSYGLCRLMLDPTNSLWTMMVGSFILMVKAGSFGTLIIYLIHPILVRIVLSLDAGASGSRVAVVSDSASLEEVQVAK